MDLCPESSVIRIHLLKAQVEISNFRLEKYSNPSKQMDLYLFQQILW